MRISLAILCFIVASLLVGWLGLIGYALVTEPELQDVNVFDSSNLPTLLILLGVLFVAVLFAVAGIVVVSGKPRNNN